MNQQVLIPQRMGFPTIGGSFHSVQLDASPEYTHAVPGRQPARVIPSGPHPRVPDRNPEEIEKRTMPFPSDLEIARGAELRPLAEIASETGIPTDCLEPYVEGAAKILSLIHI